MGESIVGPWAADKLERLRKYLHAYTTIMKDQGGWCRGFYYIDAFAGPGEHKVRRDDKSHDAQQAILDVATFGSEQEEQQRLLAGSPRVALDLLHPFTHYVFVERNPKRVEALEKLETEYGTRRSIVIRQEDCTKYLHDSVVFNKRINWDCHRALVFLDPFGMQVQWKTIEELAATEAIEIFLNFPVGMAIQRLLLRQPEKFTESQRQKLDAYFGSPDWINELYKVPKTQKTLFGDDEAKKIDASGKALVDWYRKRLSGIFKFVSKALLIRNTRGGHLYYLLVASRNENGVKIANSVLKE